MTEPAVARPLVRPRFLKWSIAVFVMLVPFAAHAVADYVQSWRLAKNIASIKENGEPVSSIEIPRVPVKGELADADRLYRAAAALSRTSSEDEVRSRFFARVFDAFRQDKWPADLVAEMRRRVSDGAEALHLLDRATALGFEEFSPGTDYSYRYAELLRLQRLARLRTVLLALEGDGNRAAESAYSELRLVRALERASPFPASVEPVTSLAVVLRRAAPDNTRLAQLASALSELDRDDALKDYLLRERAQFLDNVTRPPRQSALTWWIWRPWGLREANRRVETFATLIEAAHRRWPQKLDPVSRAYAPRSDVDARFHELDAHRLNAFARALAHVRCARVMVAASRYRLEHNRWPPGIDDLVPAYLEAAPIDPFSGTVVRYVVQGDSYQLWSVGSLQVGRAGRGERVNALDIDIRMP